MTVSGYTRLIQQVVSVFKSSDSQSNLLQGLKDLFKEGINSVRRLEQITTIEQLLQVLELRDLLSEDNVTLLKDVAKAFKNKNLFDQIIFYEDNHVPRQPINCYHASEKKNKSMSVGGVRDKKKELIFQEVTERIGNAWRDLARNLKIQECKIDEIDDKYSTLATKASKMLKLFSERADTEKWHFVLCEALDKTGRIQLRLVVQDKLMMNIQ